MLSNAVHHDFPDQTTLVNQLATTITDLLIQGIAANGKASLAVSGGTTPVALFLKLSTADIPWNKVHITLVDERWVEPDEEDSNERLVRTYLLRNRAAKASFTGMKNSAETAGVGEDVCEKALKNIPQPFDVLLLGMGGDGHTASLFPGAKKLAAATDMLSGKICMGIAPLTAPHERMTLTLPAILNAGKIFIHITGTEKKKVLTKAEQDGPEEEFPVRFVLRQTHTPVSVYWAE